jgi:hypothetical protein
MPRRSQHDEDYDYDEYDEHEDVRKLRRPREDGKKIEKKKLWERESVPDYDERR